MFQACLCHAVLSVPCSIVIICWERADPLAFFVVFCHFPIWGLGSDVVLDCIDSRSLPSSLLSSDDNKMTSTKHSVNL